MVSYLFPLLVVVGIAFWYLRMYKKGQAAGAGGGVSAGIAAGFAQAQKEKWGDVLGAGEEFKVWGSGVLWRPSWQYWLANQMPLLKLLWPMKVYSLVLTDRGRLLLATYSAFGGLSDKEGHDQSAVRLSDVTEEKQSWLMKMNPLVSGSGYTSFGATLNLPNRALKLYAVPGDFVNALSS